MRVALAGCGKMGSALLRGWCTNPVVKDIHVLDPYPPSLPVSSSGSPAIVFSTDAQSWKSDPPPVDVLVLAVKPQILDSLCAEFAGIFPSSVIVLSIAAGRSLASLAKHFGTTHTLIRAMPNTPAAIGEGITVLCAPPALRTDPQSKSHIETLLQPCGKLAWIEDESLMDSITALSGSGPAYVFYLIDVLAESGRRCGLPENLAEDLARQTVIGSAALAAHSFQDSATTLRQNVTSPNGTTEAALRVLMDGRLQSLFDEAIKKAADRSRELGL